MYKLSPNCTAGKYLVQYLPEVRGFYHVSIQVPSVQEVQLIEIVSDGNLGGNFTLTVAAEDSEGTLVYSTTSILDMTSSESNIESALSALSNVNEVNVDMVAGPTIVKSLPCYIYRT